MIINENGERKTGRHVDLESNKDRSPKREESGLEKEEGANGDRKESNWKHDDAKMSVVVETHF